MNSHGVSNRFVDDANGAQRLKIQRHLTNRYEHKQTIFEETDPIVVRYVSQLWQRILEEQKLDTSNISKHQRMIDADTMQHTDAREIGAERIGLHAWVQLNLTQLLQSKGWTEEKTQLAASASFFKSKANSFWILCSRKDFFG